MYEAGFRKLNVTRGGLERPTPVDSRVHAGCDGEPWSRGAVEREPRWPGWPTYQQKDRVISSEAPCSYTIHRCSGAEPPVTRNGKSTEYVLGNDVPHASWAWECGSVPVRCPGRLSNATTGIVMAERIGSVQTRAHVFPGPTQELLIPKTRNVCFNGNCTPAAFLGPERDRRRRTNRVTAGRTARRLRFAERRAASMKRGRTATVADGHDTRKMGFVTEELPPCWADQPGFDCTFIDLCAILGFLCEAVKPVS